MARNKFDCVIIGGGPAGITAAIYLARRNLSVLMIYERLGGQASLTSDIENYSGFRMVSGVEFTERLNEHLKEYDITQIEGKVTGVEKKGEEFLVSTVEKKIRARSVIVASGARQRKLRIKGEEEFLNRGVAYCATCDAPLFRGKSVVVIGGGNSAMESALQLKEYAKRVYIMMVNNKLQGEDILMDKIRKCKKIKIICCSSITEIKGSQFVEEIIYENDEKNSLKVEGVFVEIGYVANSEIFKVRKNKMKEIVIDNKNRTSVEGMFGAGDVTSVPVKQIIVAAGEGAKAAISCAEYLSKK